MLLIVIDYGGAKNFTSVSIPVRSITAVSYVLSSVGWKDNPIPDFITSCDVVRTSQYREDAVL